MIFLSHNNQKEIHMSRIATLALTMAAAGTLFTACNKPETGPQTTSDVQNEAQKVATAIQAGKPVKCTITKLEGADGEAMQMEYYIKGEKIKMTGVEIEGNEQEQGAMISDGEFIYVWDDQTKEGFKFPAVDPDENQEIADQTAQNQPDLPDFSKEDVQQQYQDQGYRLDCDQTNVADSEFVPPTDVTFQDFSAMMKNVMEEAAKQYQQ